MVLPHSSISCPGPEQPSGWSPPSTTDHPSHGFSNSLPGPPALPPWPPATSATSPPATTPQSLFLLLWPLPAVPAHQALSCFEVSALAELSMQVFFPLLPPHQAKPSIFVLGVFLIFYYIFLNLMLLSPLRNLISMVSKFNLFLLAIVHWWE